MRAATPLFLLLATPALAQPPTQVDLIPLPVSLQYEEGVCTLICPWQLEVDEAASKELFDLLHAELIPLQPAQQVQCILPIRIGFRLMDVDTLMPSEGYRLTIRPNEIEVMAPSSVGLFRGSRTLVQLLEQGRSPGALPCLTIIDHPRFPWRGMHLDVCRHFFQAGFVKKYIDLQARYKMNTFHWHLTEDQGWRIEIKKHPKLTEVGAWRSGSQIGPYAAQTFDNERYGGFYTQDEIREVVAHAARRHVTIVPEIEMPGHAMAALASYPHLGCTGGPYEVQRGWGVFDDVFCAGNDSVFTFLEDVLTEVMDLFPGEYIHIGGDECPKTRWKSCPKCQARMKAEGLKDEHELQSYFIRRIERFVNSKGRKIIGWDEILEGGLAPNAAVMSWRGTEGGIAAARAGHHAVMSPGSHCYFDHYQGDPANERVAIGGYTTVQKVYGYEPIPAELKPGEQRYILGAQGNVWTEYILSPEHVEYMAVPRMLALAEVLWTPEEKRDEADFLRRLEAEFPRLDDLDVHASRAVYEVRINPSQGSAPGRIRIEMVSPLQRPITYSIIHVPGTSTYTGPFEIDRERVIGAGLTEHEGGEHQHRTIRSFHFNMATARPITLSSPPHERYSGYGAFTLVDGVRGGPARGGNEWLAWKNDVTITVDLGEEKDITRIGIGALGDTHSWIHLPREVVFSTSSDGTLFTTVGTAQPKSGDSGKVELVSSTRTKARYVRAEVRSAGAIPDGLPGAGHPAWLFLDEVEVR
ncbi:MAG: family 20 glycosylhydrolase [Flavobacteriales bacterium]|nr:family 20 glycosylhydrolase [Flavobacteriales bacterium]